MRPTPICRRPLQPVMQKFVRHNPSGIRPNRVQHNHIRRIPFARQRVTVGVHKGVRGCAIPPHVLEPSRAHVLGTRKHNVPEKDGSLGRANFNGSGWKLWERLASGCNNEEKCVEVPH